MYAYNNLAFIYNMHQYYSETITVCTTAKLMLEHHEKLKAMEKGVFIKNDEELHVNHLCHRHWAFALFKKGDMGKACKLVKESIRIDH